MAGLLLHVYGAEKEGISSALRVAHNARKDLSPAPSIEIVVQGAAVRFLTESPSILPAALNGVRVLACSNSLASAGLAPSDVVAPAEPISSAVGHLTRRQMAGWAYVRL
ncbi:MAG: hypothetical protein LKJ57_01750 [Ancrocorticia sp.]|jgi:intracellular sulfur oxidation DsrE/DsrF family protein|nr:hypothetical protein [Ancrocorticia sp.]MCI1932262.1 hypothetical protein [Ancrocorticia sp.]MCI1963076.1 hypothetical protein [Ancrocorticia sp.]MCI2001444.1 hypothetical protein [Ancrocorticia sp.]MCI2012316.1 hypothetical protein [Ancrocorticia sp.]